MKLQYLILVFLFSFVINLSAFTESSQYISPLSDSNLKIICTENMELYSGDKTLSSEELEPFSFRFFVSPLLVPLNCDNLSKENEYRISDFSSEIFSTVG